jgi:CBS domain-containing protein/Flp pilus assembly pilin Flp
MKNDAMGTPEQKQSHLRAEAACCEIARFVRASGGAAIVEYALLLAVLIASGVTAYAIVAIQADRVFETTTRLMGSVADSEAMPLAETASAQTSHVAIREPSDRSAGMPTANAQIAIVWVVLWVAIATASLTLWRLLRSWPRAARARSSDGDTVVGATPPRILEQLFSKRQQIRRILSRGFEQPLTREVQVQQLMSTDIVTIAPGVSSADAAGIMTNRRIRHLLVCAKNRLLVGIISDRDIKERTGTIAEDIMTREPVTVSPETALAPAITLMLTKGISCLPVVSRTGKLCGILTTTDLMLSLQCTLQVLVAVTSGVSDSIQSSQADQVQILTDAPERLSEISQQVPAMPVASP